MPSVGSGTYSPGPNMGCSPQKEVRTGSVEAITCPGYSNLRIPATVSVIGPCTHIRRRVFLPQVHWRVGENMGRPPLRGEGRQGTVGLVGGAGLLALR